MKGSGVDIGITNGAVSPSSSCTDEFQCVGLERGPARPVTEGIADRLREGGRIVGFEEEARLAVLDEFSMSAYIGCNNQAAAGHGLKRL